MDNKRPTALVAGGAGFLGSYLCEALLAQNFNVIAVDGTATSAAKKNIGRLLSSRNFSFWEEDISRANFKLSPTVPLSHIFHCDVVEEQSGSKDLSLQALVVNSLGTKNLLDLAHERGAKFILVSSTEVIHGAISQISLENYFNKPQQLATPFNEAKRFAEALTAQYYKNYDVYTSVVRIKDPYGPKMALQGGGILDQLIAKAIYDGRIDISGDGLKQVNPTFVTDIIYGIVKAAAYPKKGKIFNVVNPQKATERSVSEEIKKILPGIGVDFKKEPEGGVDVYPIPIDLTEEELGWEPKISLAQGLKETISFFKAGQDKGLSADGTEKITYPTSPQKKSTKSRKFLTSLVLASVALLLIWSTLLPPALLAMNVYFGQKNMQTALELLLADEPNQAKIEAGKAHKKFRSSSEATRNFFWIGIIPSGGESLKQTENLVLYAESISAAMRSTARSLELLKESSSSGSSDEEPLTRLEEAIEELESAERDLQIANSVSINPDKLYLPLPDIYKELERGKQGLEEVTSSLEQALKF
ncbi:MAG: NAD-dependent epimerase/dehydratase family protein [Candidatus Woykebacteria bacterium]